MPWPRNAARTDFWEYAPLVLALALRLASAPTANLSYLLIAGYALFGKPHAIRALAMSWLFTMMSSGIAPTASAGAVGRYAVLFAAALSALIHSGFFSRPRLRPFTVATIMLGGFIIGHSMLFSPMVDVSVLKAVSWTLGMATSISIWCGLTAWERDQVSEQIFWGLVMILVVSLPLAATSTGYLVNGSGFQGVLNQPQVFGSVMALLGAWATARIFSIGARPPWWLLGIAGVSLAGIMMSEARTGGLAMVGGLALAILIGPVLGKQSLRIMLPGLRSARVWGLVIALGVAGVIFAPLISDKVQNFISKSGRTEVGSVLEAYDRSRGVLIEPMLSNIAENPWLGIGFGIASEPLTMNVSRDPILGLPIGASIEKGVTPLMVLEELGIFGALFVAFWLLRLLRSSARSDLAPFAVCLTALLLNMGEATLFSPGGMGLLVLVLLGWTYSIGRSHRTVRNG